MFFTFKSSKYYSHPHTVVPEQFGGDGISTISQQINMNVEEELIAIAEFNTNTARQLRQNEYPPLTDLADAMYWSSQGDNTKLEAYYAACEAVKLKYPKATNE
jgi:hypothetical protein